MLTIKGIPVVWIGKRQVGTDPFGRPVCTDVEEIVENVLVSPASPQEITDTLELHGKKAVYTLGIPKGDGHQWEGARVRFFGQTFQTIGYPVEGIEAMIPLDWHKKVQVERYG